MRRHFVTKKPNSTIIFLAMTGAKQKNGCYSEASGFTLAEVLITLGIIGIVAAIILPTIIAKSQSFVLKNQFKKEYAVISQAINKSEFDMGGTVNCNYGINVAGADCDMLWETMKQNLKIIKSCEGQSGNSVEMGCIPNYEGLEMVLFKNGGTQEEIVELMHNVGGWSSQSNGIKSKYAYVLADGSIFITYFNNWPLCFALDVNGKKGPNQWGHDLFYFGLSKRNGNVNNPINIDGRSFPVEKGGKTSIQMLRDI